MPVKAYFAPAGPTNLGAWLPSTSRPLTDCSVSCYTWRVIRSFRHKGLRELFEQGSSRKIRPDLETRALRRLDALDAAESLEALDVPGFDFHPLRGKPQRYSLHVNGPWCITFEWDDGEAVKVDLEQYH